MMTCKVSEGAPNRGAGLRDMLWRSGTATLAAALLLAAPLAQGQDTLRERWMARHAERADRALPAGVQVLRDVAYGPGARQRFDVYLPPPGRSPAGVVPIVFMVHGGAWRMGDKAHAPVVAHKVAHWVAQQGLVLVSTNYGLLPGTPVAEQLQDVARALAAVQREAARWGGDPQRVVAMGHSAGAHLVALLAARTDLATAAGALPVLGTVALDSAALDVPRIMQAPHMPLYDEPFGADPAQWEALSPWHQWRPGVAPLLAVCSSPRRVSCEQARSLQARAATLATRVEVLPQALDHGEINARLGEPGAYTQAVDAFLRSLPGWPQR